MAALEEVAQVAAGEKQSINPEAELSELVPRLREAAGRNLVSVIVYGSAAGKDFRREYSDLNVLVVANKFPLEALKALSPVMTWWRERGHPPVVLFTRDEIDRSADVFAIELYDMKERHRVLEGEDVFAKLEIPMSLHRVQLEHELRTNLLRLRQAYIADTGEQSVMHLMLQSISTFGTLFRHVLIALGQQPPAHRREATVKLGEVVGFDPKPFVEIYDMREGRSHAMHVDDTFRIYLFAIEQVTNWVDKKLE
ncbi:MAG TPA: nucleotidyltransferase domain-containing protein [Candidatus Koribacter sp.]